MYLVKRAGKKLSKAPKKTSLTINIIFKVLSKLKQNTFVSKLRIC